MMPTYHTFKRSANNWEEFSRASKITCQRGLSLEEARRQCAEFNSHRSTTQEKKGTKLEFEAE